MLITPIVSAVVAAAIPVTVSAQPAAAVPVEAPIDAVTVYPDGATVTRQVTLPLVRGSNTVRIINLASSLSGDRLRVEVHPQTTTLDGVTVTKVERDFAADPDVRRVETALADARQAAGAVSDASRTAKLKLQFIEGVSQGYAKESWFESARGDANISSWRDALKVIDAESGDAFNAIRANDLSLRAHEATIARLERELAQLTGRARASTQIELRLTSADTGGSTVRVHYPAHQAGWTPAYEARVNSKSGDLQLTQRANVRQATQEDWHAVSLTLSSARPDEAAEVNLPAPRFVNLVTPEMSAAVAQQKGRFARFAESAASDATIEEIVVTGSYQNRAAVNAYAVSYHIPGRVSLNNATSEGALFDLGSHGFAAELVTRIVPETSRSAFLGARFTYTRAEPLYPAPANVYVDGTFNGTTMLPTMLEGKDVHVALGQDRRVEVQRIDKGGQVDESGFIGRNTTVPVDFLISVTNHRDTPSQIEVYDRWPVSRHEDVRVSVPRNATPPTAKDIEDRPGVLLWKKSLEGGESWEIRHAYSLTHPSDAMINW